MKDRTVKQVANQLYELLAKQEFFTIYDTLFHSSEIEHFESKAQGEDYRYLKGIEAIKSKSAAFIQMVSKIEGPALGGLIIMSNAFAIPYSMSVELKDGRSFTMDEIIVYEVDEGLVVKEHIFY